MSKNTMVMGLVAVVAVFVIAGLYWILRKPTDTQMPTATVSPTEAITSVPATPTSASKYSPQLRAIIRSTFIASCEAKVGKQYATACNCAADYLAANYSDSQLEKAYADYHSSNKTPSAVQAAYDACKDK